MRRLLTKCRRASAVRAATDAGQAALIVVISLVVLLATFGGVMINSIVTNAPILTQANIQRYAYRALASGLNSYQTAINGNPYLAACNANTNYPSGPNANAQCAGLSYDTWSQVPGTDVGNGVVPEFYMFENPQEVESSTTSAITYLEVQVVGAAGFPANLVYYSTVARFVPQNGFLNGVWWSNYESFNDNAGGSAATCDYFYNQGRTISGGGTVGATPCVYVSFISGDALYGPVYTNDSVYVIGNPTFTGTVNTADPHCLFVDPGTGATDSSSNPTCASLDAGISYTVNGSGFGRPKEPLPTDDSQLSTYAKQGGCYYEGPTTVQLSVVGGVGKMTVNSPDTAGYPNNDTMNTSGIGDPNCPTSTAQGAQALPNNGVLFVNGASSPVAGANPFDTNTNGATKGLSQVQSLCPNCYYAQSSTPDSEGDAFVHGNLSGHLTVAASNDVLVDGPISYADCTWAGTASQSLCAYNNA